MDNMAYLQQIADDSHPKAKPSKGIGNLLNPKLLLIIGGAVVLFIIIAIVGSIINGLPDKTRAACFRLDTRIAYLDQTINDYHSYLKATGLRSMDTSLKTTLTDTARNLTATLPYIDFPKTPKNASENDSIILTEEATLNTDLNDTLETALLNGQLDRTYHREMTLQIALLLSLESEILERSDNPELLSAINTSYDSLSNLYTQFSEYTNPAF